jgi:orotate phosphoribosyltransferase
MRIGMQISQTNLAKKLGVSPQTVSKWENHISSPDISVLPQIARFFGISMDELFDYRTEGEHYKDEFVRFLFKNKMLQFGSFDLKSGRISPYYVHCGLLNLSSRIASLGLFFAECMHEHFLHTSCLVGFTPRETALAVATGIAFYQKFGVEVKCCTDIDVLRQMDADTPLCLITDTFTSGQTLCYELDFFKKKIGRIPKDVLV